MVYKKYFLIFFKIALLMIPVVSSGQDVSRDSSGYKKFYYPNGRLSSEGMLRNGKPDGYWKSYFENGKIKSEGNRINFKLNSLFGIIWFVTIINACKDFVWR